METTTRKSADARETSSKGAEEMSLGVVSARTAHRDTRRQHSNDSGRSRSSSYSSQSSGRHSTPTPKKGSRSRSASSDGKTSCKDRHKKRRLSSSEDSNDAVVLSKKNKSSVHNARSFRKRSSSRSQSTSPSRERSSDVDLKHSSDLEKQTSHSSERELENCVAGRKLKKAPSKESYVDNSRKKSVNKNHERSPLNLDRHNSKERSCSVDSRLEKSTGREPSSKAKDRSPHYDHHCKSTDHAQLSEKDKEKKSKESDDKNYRSRSKSRDKRSHRYKSRSRSRSRDHRSRSKGRSYRSRRDDSPRKRRSRSRDRYSYRSRLSPRKKRSRSRSRDRRRRSRSRSGSHDRLRHRYRSRRSSSHDRYRRHHSVSRSRSRSHSRLSSREKSKSDLVSTSTSVGSLPLSTTTGAMTPQMALQQTMAQMSAKAQALTGIALPKYYNPAAVNPLKYAEQVQKRKLLWQTKEKAEEPTKSSVWDKLTFSQDDDGKMTAKFRKLMGMKADSVGENPPESEICKGIDESALKKQEELFRNLDQQYEMARISTHTHRGVGLGYTSQAIFPPVQK